MYCLWIVYNMFCVNFINRFGCITNNTAYEDFPK